MKLTFRSAVLIKKASSVMSVTISTGITFASDDYLIKLGSLILQNQTGPKTSTGPSFQKFY